MKNQLRLLRAERSWSQAELASRLGVSRQTVNAIETGKYDPSLPLAFQVAALFGLPIEQIFHWETVEVPATQEVRQERSIERLDLVRPSRPVRSEK